VVETLQNIRTVAALCMERQRATVFSSLVVEESGERTKKTVINAVTVGLAHLSQLWVYALLFWWAGWLVSSYPSTYDFTNFVVSLFVLIHSISGLATAAEDMADIGAAKEAGVRVFGLIDRKSEMTAPIVSIPSPPEFVSHGDVDHSKNGIGVENMVETLYAKEGSPRSFENQCARVP